MAITEVITAPRSPWQNACVERVIGSIRRECLDHIVIFNERHLRRILSSYVDCSPPDSHPSLARQGLPRVTPGYATQSRKCRRHPESGWFAPPLRTARCLTRTISRQSTTPAAHTRRLRSRYQRRSTSNSSRIAIRRAVRFASSLRFDGNSRRQTNLRLPSQIFSSDSW